MARLNMHYNADPVYPVPKYKLNSRLVPEERKVLGPAAHNWMTGLTEADCCKKPQVDCWIKDGSGQSNQEPQATPTMNAKCNNENQQPRNAKCE